MTPDEKKALFAQVVREGRTLARVCKKEGVRDESCKEALALLINETEAFQLDKAIRAWIEAKYAEAKRFHGMAKAIYLGLKKVGLQILLTTIALNIKRMFTLLKALKAPALLEPRAA